VLQTARCLKTELQRGTRQIKDSIAEKTKRKMVKKRKEDAWTNVTQLIQKAGGY
jgi:hypothetical protein